MNQERQSKREQFTQPEPQKRRPIIIAVAVLLVVCAAAGWLMLNRSAGGAAESLVVVNGSVRIPIEAVNDGTAHYFSHRVDGQVVDFFVIKSVDGVMRAAFDACDVCYREKKGYRQDGNYMVCNNCEMRFKTDLINEVKGGCNPAPLKRLVDSGEVVIRTADIAAGRWYFN
ncbi:MAG: DUF2318 domain-containing protein [Desulfuromonas sp.]|nr:MAG: DUF2318 domain-containing protein [Desulfuromonas sp.]